jgi:hypothetical protein
MAETTAGDVRAAMREAANLYLDTSMEDGGKLAALDTLALGFRDLDTGTVLTADGRPAFTEDADTDSAKTFTEDDQGNWHEVANPPRYS